jgi:predicted ATP-binding protein involved in virulence
LKITANIETNSLILIDEPEISLHVSWQRLLPKILEEISSHFASVIVVATHSPIIISEATGQADRCFLAEQRVTTIIQEQDRRSIEALLFESFKTHTINNREVHEKCAKLLRQSIEIANQEIFNDHQIESNIATLRAMQKIVLNNGNDMSGNLQSFKNDFVFIESAIDAIRKIKDLRGAGS